MMLMNPITSTYDAQRILTALKVERVMIWKPGREWTYSHHAHIVFFKEMFYAIWSNGRKDEDAPGQRIMISSSRDFISWSIPKPLVDSLPGKGSTEFVLTAAGFHQYAGTLAAYFGQYEEDKSETCLRAVTTTDGAAWSPIREMNIPVNPNHGPQPTRTGRLIIAGNISFPCTDDPAGLNGWKMSGVFPPQMAGMSDNPASFWEVKQKMNWPVALCEGAFYQTDDGIIHMLLRATGPGYRGRLWVTESRDDGTTWGAPLETQFGDADTKFHFGRLPDKRFYYVGCPDPNSAGKRSPLILSISEDGHIFDRHFRIADEPYVMRFPGRWKGGEYGYPHTMVRNGHLYVIVSRQKEAVEVIRLSLDQVI